MEHPLKSTPQCMQCEYELSPVCIITEAELYYSSRYQLIQQYGTPLALHNHSLSSTFVSLFCSRLAQPTFSKLSLNFTLSRTETPCCNLHEKRKYSTACVVVLISNRPCFLSYFVGLISDFRKNSSLFSRLFQARQG